VNNVNNVKNEAEFVSEFVQEFVLASAEFSVVAEKIKRRLPGFEAEIDALVPKFKESVFRLAKSDPYYTARNNLRGMTLASAKNSL